MPPRVARCGLPPMKFASPFFAGCGVLIRVAAVLTGLSNVVSADPPPVREVRWLEGNDAPETLPGTTWGVPWPRGAAAAGTSFTLIAADGKPVPVQSWPLATWPDGSLKWTAHAIPAGAGAAAPLRLEPGKPVVPPTAVSVVEEPETITVNTGVIECRIRRTGNHFLDPSGAAASQSPPTDGWFAGCAVPPTWTRTARSSRKPSRGSFPRFRWNRTVRSAR